MAELKFEITEHFGVLSQNARGWTKELNKISWNEREPKWDIREWNPDHTRMGKGVTLSEEEVDALRKLLNGEELEDDIDEDAFV
ncbi:MAG: YdbC family protein [Ruminococcus sp.]|nr:YdbC family protein [Ruminococcus sp.]MCR5141143.1 YdbC family protein [Ruminococcus sp.]